PTSVRQQDVHPTHLHLTFSPAELGTAVPSTLNIRDALLASVHSGQVSPSAVRISLELAGVGAYRVRELRSPDQVVIYLRKAPTRSRPEPEASRQKLRSSRRESQTLLQEPQRQRPEQETLLPEQAPQGATLPASLTLPPVAKKSPRAAESALLSSSNNGAQNTRGYRIMLDPGHGGYDPGAQGV